MIYTHESGTGHTEWNIFDFNCGSLRYLQSKEQATSEEELKMFTLKVWRKIAPFYLKFLYKSRPRQMKAVVDAQGGHTKYLMYILHGI